MQADDFDCFVTSRCFFSILHHERHVFKILCQVKNTVTLKNCM